MADQSHDAREQETYKSRQGDKDPIPVQGDSEPVEDPINEGTADSDAQLAQDDTDAIDKSNILNERTRGAKPNGPGYSEGPDEDDIPEQ